MLPDIDFAKIRPLKNSRNKGFEELCVQHFRSSFPEKTEFYRVDDAGGDGGVEDIALLKNGKKIGLQAKYLEKIEQCQWTQINKSVLTALKTHYPDMEEYRIACSCNRSKNSKTWSNYCSKWQEYAESIGYDKKIDFIWYGETELRSEITDRKHHSKVYYWFGCKQFSQEWLKEKFEAAKLQIDTRYTPKHHVRTESENILDAFFLTDGFRSSFWKTIRTMISSASDNLYKIGKVKLLKEEQNLGDAIGHVRSLFNDKSSFLPASSECEEAFHMLKEKAVDLYNEYEKLQKEKEANTDLKKNSYDSRPYSYELARLGDVFTEIQKAVDFIHKFNSYDKCKSLVIGDAGSGKTHLLASSVENALKQGQPAILLTGEQFSTSDPPLMQLCRILLWEDEVEALLSSLNSFASLQGKPAIIAIDALNESNDKRLWKNHLLGMESEILKYPNLRLLISCRSDFIRYVLPKSFADNQDPSWSKIDHQGFKEEIFNAVATYFKGYNVSCVHFPPIIDEFQNPLFLKTFCETYANDSVPSGPISFDQILKRRVKKSQELILNSVNCPEYKVKNAIDLIADKISENHGQAIPYNEIRPEIDKIFDGGGETNSLYIQLRSNGLIVETLKFVPDAKNETEIMVRFPYERFSDYFIASKLLDNYINIEQLKTAWQKDFLPDKWIEGYPAMYANRGLLQMLAILVPQRFGCEFISLFKSDNIPGNIVIDFISSLPWRSINTITPHSEKLFSWCQCNLNFDAYLKWLLKLVTIPDHPFNAIRLHSELSKMKLPDRELYWTVPIAKMSSLGYGGVVNDLLRWSFNVPLHMVSDEQAWTVSLFLSWLLTSNYRFLRNRVTLALIRILNGKAKLAVNLVKEFHNCNDPYVVERVYAVACGVALRETDKKALENLALTVNELMFSGKHVPPHILQRDYAQVIMEYAKHCSALPENVEIRRCRPLFHSKWPHIISEDKAKEIENDDGWHYVTSSVQPEESGMGMYGDFGRYVMDAYVHHFSQNTLKQSLHADNSRSNAFSGLIARRYILQRIKELGWSPERFVKYEKNIRSGRLSANQEHNKVERISKKYQWIALYELLGFLSDQYRMTQDYGSSEIPIYKGAWQIMARDFDPTQPLIDPQITFDLDTEESIIQNNAAPWWITYPDPFSDLKLRLDRERWISAIPEDFTSLIEQDNVPNQVGKWLVLSGHYNWEETLHLSQDEGKEGQLKMWSNLRCWLIYKNEMDDFLKKMDRLQFYGNGCMLPQFSDQWIGEYPWASSMERIIQICSVKDDWLEDINVNVIQTVCKYSNELAKADAGLPSPFLCNLLKLKWSGLDYGYVNSDGILSAFCPSYKDNTEMSNSLIVRKDDFLSAVDKAGLFAVWAVLSERSCYSRSKNESIVKKWGITQRLYSFENGVIACIHNKQYEIPLFK